MQGKISGLPLRPLAWPEHRPALLALDPEGATDVPVLCRTLPQRFQPLCRDHLILGQQFSEGVPGALAQARFIEKLLLRSSWQQAPQSDFHKYTVEGRLNVCAEGCSTLLLLAHLLDEKGEHDLRRWRGAALDSA